MGKTMVAVSRGTELGTDWVVLTLRDGQAVNAARYLFEGARVAVDRGVGSGGAYHLPESAAIGIVGAVMKEMRHVLIALLVLVIAVNLVNGAGAGLVVLITAVLTTLTANLVTIMVAAAVPALLAGVASSGSLPGTGTLA